MEKVESTNDIIDERVELMVSPLGGNPTVRSARFLKPCVNWFKNSPRLLPSTLFSESAIYKPLIIASDIGCDGWPQDEWSDWEERLRSKYEHAWRGAGILEAIKASTYRVEWSNDLLLGLAQMWYSETNTFIFSWGEATITLEDVMVCGGFSVLGFSVFTLLEDEESKQMEKKLVELQGNLMNTQDRSSGHLLWWLRHFIKEKGELEHTAFLSLWLARFVISCEISEQIFHIAMHLARGTPIALAPAVLASIYRDLILLKSKFDEAVNSVTNKNDEYCVSAEPIVLRAPLQLLHIWALERFPSLHANPNIIPNFQPIIAKWHRVKMINCHDVSLALDFPAKSFIWRPYKNPPKLYNEKDQWECSKCLISGSRKYLESFARCLRHSELVGKDCIEKYLPHRVAMQFGLDQDIPVWVDHCRKTCPMTAWRNYDSPMTNALLCIAAVESSSTSEPSVTSKYLEWWKRSRLGWREETNKDSRPISIYEKLWHASAKLGSHSHSHRTGESDQNYGSTDKEHKKRSHNNETKVAIAHGVENLTE